jgi:AraC-like DNA-binding protein
MLPSGGAQLIFTLHEVSIVCNQPATATPLTWSRGIVHGPQSSYYESGAKPAGCIVGVAFRPGAAGAILGAPITDFTDRHVTIDAMWGHRGEELREKLLAADGPRAVFGVLERELTKRLLLPLKIHPAVAHALGYHRDAWSPVRVADVQRAAGYSPRHFVALFRAAVGLTPKHFYRVKRFTTVLRRLADGYSEGLADLAGSAGYSDQAHLTREFREFAGITPTQYRPRNRESPHHQAVQASIRIPSKVRNLQD